jgi:CRP/FNR family transcriptional regulator
MSDEFFQQLKLFQGLTPSQRDLLRPLFIPCDYYADAVIFDQGDPAEYLFAVVVGDVMVSFKPEDGPPITVTHAQPGDIVGWSAALGTRRYTSSAICTTYTQLLRVSGADLRILLTRHPDTGVIVLDRLAAIIAERLNNTHTLVVSLLELGLRNNVYGQTEDR